MKRRPVSGVDCLCALESLFGLRPTPEVMRRADAHRRERLGTSRGVDVHRCRCRTAGGNRGAVTARPGRATRTQPLDDRFRLRSGPRAEVALETTPEVVVRGERSG